MEGEIGVQVIGRDGGTLIERLLSPRFTFEVRYQGSGLLGTDEEHIEGYIQWNTESGNDDETATYRLTDCAETKSGKCARPLQTGAVFSGDEGWSVSPGSTIFLEDWGERGEGTLLTVWDSGGRVGPYQVDVYAGVGNDALVAARQVAQDNSRVWLLVPIGETSR